jgi:Fur family zinc uptake transcriptional regulator
MARTAFETHDHRHCIAESLVDAERTCAEQGLRLTPARRRVLEILLEEHRALGAYDILDRLRAEGWRAQPPVAYRALDFLTSHGFAHRVEGLNAFVACTHGKDGHAPVFLICRACNRVTEAEAELTSGALGRAAKTAGFRIEQTVREAIGLCPACLATEAA